MRGVVLAISLPHLPTFLHSNHVSYTRTIHPTQEPCILHRNHASYTGTMHPTQEPCILHRNHASYTGTMYATRFGYHSPVLWIQTGRAIVVPLLRIRGLDSSPL